MLDSPEKVPDIHWGKKNCLTILFGAKMQRKHKMSIIIPECRDQGGCFV